MRTVLLDPGWLVIKPMSWMRMATVRLNELRLAPDQQRAPQPT